MKTNSFINPVEDYSNSDSVKMSIDADSIDYLMTNLTNLYADPVASVIREYTSNAYDSHVRAGATQPILVTFDASGTTFTVEDFGVGMSKQEIIDIYSKYGLSTKNNTNDEIGAFGLGAKSALAIADRFDIVARKNGVETIAYVEKNSKGVGVVHFVSENPTTDPNGFKVSVKSRSFSSESNLKAKIFFNFIGFPSGAFLVNGVQPESLSDAHWIKVEDEGETVGWFSSTSISKIERPDTDDDFDIKKFKTSEHDGSVKFNVGGVIYSYPVSDINSGFARMVNYMFSDYSAVLNLPIGSVDLTPSREAIMNTEKSHQAVAATVERFVKQFELHVDRMISRVPIDEALNVIDSMVRMYYWKHEYNYCGTTLNLHFSPRDGEYYTAMKAKNSSEVYVRAKRNDQSIFEYSSSASGFLIRMSKEDLENKEINRDMINVLAKEAAYYANSMNAESNAGFTSEVNVVSEEWFEETIPSILRDNRKTYTFNEFVDMVKTRRTEVRKTAASNRKAGVVKNGKKEIVIPVARVVKGETIIFRPVAIKELKGKTAYIDANESSNLYSLIPVLGWHYNNGGVRMVKPYGRRGVYNSALVQEVFEGWNLAIIPSRRRVESVTENVKNIVNAVDVVEKYLSNKQKNANNNDLVSAYITAFESVSGTSTNIDRILSMIAVEKKSDYTIANTATKKVCKMVEEINTVSADESMLMTVGQLYEWRMLDEDVKEKAFTIEHEIASFIKEYPLISDMLQRAGLESFEDEKTINHIIQYVNMVDES